MFRGGRLSAKKGCDGPASLHTVSQQDLIATDRTDLAFLLAASIIAAFGKSIVGDVTGFACFLHIGRSEPVVIEVTGGIERHAPLKEPDHAVGRGNGGSVAESSTAGDRSDAARLRV